ncbi:MAG: lactate racemase domain-containing protein [Candidatus Eiseniibacteriota bacterium]
MAAGSEGRVERIRLGRDEVAIRWPAGIEPERMAPIEDEPSRPDFSPGAAARGLVRELPASGSGPGPVLVIVPDRTRSFPLPMVLPALLDALLAYGHGRNGSPAVALAIASGTHRPATADLDNERLGISAGAVRLVRHDPDGPMAELGTTAAGTPVRVHPIVTEASAVLALGNTAFHYFAGFGGGPKLLFPGLGARESIAHNHRLSLGPFPPGGLAPGVGPGATTENPVSRDLLEVASFLPAVRHLTLWLRPGRPRPRGESPPRIVLEWDGEPWSELSEFSRVCGRYAAGRRRGTAHAADVVVASAGGWPRDIDLVQSHKALFHASLFARPGGVIVLAAECAEGTGSPTLARWLEEAKDREDLERHVRERYALNGQTAVSLATIASRFDVRWVGKVGHPALERLGVQHESDLDHAIATSIARVRAEISRTPRVAFLPQASEVVPAGDSDAGLTGAGAGS